MSGSDDTRQRLIDAAGQVFADKGFQAATIREICDRARANIAAVNYYFRDKQSLYNEAVKHAHCLRTADEKLEWPEGFTPEQKLRGFIGMLMEAMWDHDRPSWELEIVMHEMARPTEACAELVRSYIGPKFELLLGIVAEFVPVEMPQVDRHLLAFSIVGQCLLYRFHRPVGRLLVGEEEYSSFRVEQLADHIARFSIAGLRAAAHHGQIRPAAEESAALERTLP